MKNKKEKEMMKEKKDKKKKIESKDLDKIKNKKEKFEDKRKKEKFKDKKNKIDLNPSQKVKKHHVWGLGGILVGIVIAILIITLFGVKFITTIKVDSYVEGGRDALREVFNSVNDKGGLVLNFEGESIIIAKYNKETNTLSNEDLEENTSEEVIEEIEEPLIEEPIPEEI